MTTEKKQEFIISCLYGLLILLIGYVVMKYLFGLVLPFLIGFAIAFALRPVVEFLERKTGKRGKLWSALVLVLAYGVVCGLVALGCWKGVRELLELVEQLPEVYTGTLGPALRALVLRLAELAARPRRWAGCSPPFPATWQGALRPLPPGCPRCW